MMRIEDGYNYLIRDGMTPQGACAVLGNIQAESGFIENNVQNNCPLSDSDYTAKIKKGYPGFSTDGYGYGLCQWTYPSRKRALLNACTSRHIDKWDMQLAFMLRELKDSYKALYNELCESAEISILTRKFMRQFENPADQSYAAQLLRIGYAQKIYETFAGGAKMNKMFKVLVNPLYIYKNSEFHDVPTSKITDKGCYTVTETKTAHGVEMGRLLSGAGWVVLHSDFIRWL